MPSSGQSDRLTCGRFSVEGGDTIQEDDRMAAVQYDPTQAAREAASVRKATVADRALALDALVRAFYDDPVLQWFFPDDRRRGRQLEGLFDYLWEKLWHRHQLVYTTDRVSGVAIWLPPGRWRIGLLEQLRLLPAYAVKVGWRDLPRGLRGFNLLGSKHPHESHFYLHFLGVAPEWQGKGIGRELLQPVLARCDRAQFPAYVEATTARSRSCYERNGFRVTQEILYPNGPPTWLMWREPRAG
jgi:ribosomal protein S18 acetylase RimI-like enzyme